MSNIIPVSEATGIFLLVMLLDSLNMVLGAASQL